MSYKTFIKNYVYLVLLTLYACEDKSSTNSSIVEAGAMSGGSEAAGTMVAGTEEAGTEMAGSEEAGTEVAGTEMAGSEEGDAEAAGTETASTETAGTEIAGAEVQSTDGVLCELNHSTFNEDESVNTTSEASWTCEGMVRSLVANGVPDHSVGTFPNPECPNTISAQNVAVDFPLNPVLVSENGIATRIVAYALNGVKFEVGTAGTCTDAGDCSAIGNGGAWSMEAVGESSFDFGEDENHGHVQPFGAYHYHGMPENYLNQLGRGEQMTLIGWAVDGFPIYARYGYDDPNEASSEVKVVVSSWRLKAEADAGRPSVDIYPLGAFTQDYEYVEGFGDLDECNGRLGVTPEFPDGIYHYYITDTFPFGQRCVKGSSLVEEGMGPGGMGPGGMGPGGMEPVSCDDVPMGAPCCGDAICGGPENRLNCPADCN